MKTVIKIVLALVVVLLIFILAKNIEEPIKFQERYTERKKAVTKRLENIRAAQIAFKTVKEGYAPTFDSLLQVVNSDSFRIVTTFGNADAGEEVRQEVRVVSMKDSLGGTLGINLDSMMYVPYGGGKKFELFADTLTYQKMKVSVVDVSTKVGDFMQEFSDSEETTKRYKRYDPDFDPETVLRFGDRTKPSTSGNWEK